MGIRSPHDGNVYRRRISAPLGALVLSLLAGCSVDPATRPSPDAALRAALAQAVGAEIQAYRDPAGGTAGAGTDPLQRYYGSGDNPPLWTTPVGPSPRGRLLLERLARADEEGLDPAAYDLERVRRALATGDTGELAAAEIRLSRGLADYASDLGADVSGDGDPLATAAAAADFAAWLDRLAPAWPAYRRLRDALGRYRGIADAGGWPAIAAGPLLKPGGDDPRVPVLRGRLAMTGDLERRGAESSERYDALLAQAVAGFQRRHGLEPDGLLGERTLAALNRPVAARIAQIERSLHALRGPDFRFRELGVVVNIAAAELHIVEDGETILASRTIVGRPDWPTPALRSRITAIELNPAWFVPTRIALEEILPKARDRGPEYLQQRGFRLFDRRSRELDAAKVDWASIDGSRLPFYLRQDPGPANPLGQVKFLFANAYDVFLHDTPQRGLFARAERTLSHGCIRVERAEEMALFLLAREGWDGAAYRRALAAGRTVRVPLSEPVPLHLVVLPAWVDGDGRLQFRDDPYAPPPTRLAAASPSCTGDRHGSGDRLPGSTPRS